MAISLDPHPLPIPQLKTPHCDLLQDIVLYPTSLFTLLGRAEVFDPGVQ